MSICNTQPYTLEKYFLVLYGLFVIESDSDEKRKEYGDVVRLAKKLIKEEYSKSNIEYSIPQKEFKSYSSEKEAQEQSKVKRKILSRIFNRR